MRQAIIFSCLCLAWTSVAEPITIRGAGGTFPLQVYKALGRAFESYRHHNVDVKFRYELRSQDSIWKSVLSKDDRFTFGAAETVMTPAERSANPDVKSFPIFAGAVTLPYNIPGVSRLVLTRDAVVGIYNGTIRRWDDPEIEATNPGQSLPAEHIRAVARADASGTTEIFTRALSAISPEWSATYGVFHDGVRYRGDRPTGARWNSSAVRIYGRSNRGMAGLIYSFDYSIGYVSIAEVTSVNWSYARIVNRAGRAVAVGTDWTRRVMEEAIRNASDVRSASSLVDSPLPGAYPFLGFTYMVVRIAEMPDCGEAREFYRFVDWILRAAEARRLAAEAMFEVVIGAVGDYVMGDVMARLTCDGGVDVVRLAVEDRKREARMATYTLRVGLTVGSVVVVVVVGGLVGYAVYDRVRLKRSLWAGEWEIDAADVDVLWERDAGWTTTAATSSSSDAGSLTTGCRSQRSEGAFSHNLSPFVEKLARCGGRTVCLRRFPHREFRVRRPQTKMTIVVMKSKLIHANVLRFHGVCLMDDRLYLVSDHAQKGSLTDVLQNTGYAIDDNLKYALALDAAAGMEFLHSNGIVHGHLTSECCLMDSHWNVKITEWEVFRLYQQESGTKLSRVHPTIPEEITDEAVRARLSLWTAPELLRGELREANRKSDVYSFAIVLVEIFTREDPYRELGDRMEPAEIVRAIARDDLRPDLSAVTCADVKPVIASAWRERPELRPSFAGLIRKLKRCRKSRKPVIESMMATLELYVNNLEDMVEERTTELAAVNESLENLLYQILPPSVARRLSNGQTVEPELFSSATIFFSDIVGFTTICAASTPIQVVNLLNDLYTMFDSVIDSMDVYKVETIGDAYMCISGVPIRNGVRHVVNIADMALRFMKIAKSFQIRHMPNRKLELRAGIHTGAVVAGVVGITMPRYCLFGDTVNTASRMESTSLPMHIQVTAYTYALLDGVGHYQFEKRGNILVKGKGEMMTYFLLGTTRPLSESPSVCDYLAKIQPFPSFLNISTLVNDSAEESRRKRRVKKKVSFEVSLNDKPQRRGILK